MTGCPPSPGKLPVEISGLSHRFNQSWPRYDFPTHDSCPLCPTSEYQVLNYRSVCGVRTRPVRHPEAPNIGPLLRRYQTTCYLVHPNQIRCACVGYPTGFPSIAPLCPHFGFWTNRSPARRLRPISCEPVWRYESGSTQPPLAHCVLLSWVYVWRSRVEYVCRVVYLWCTVCSCPCHLWRVECCARSHMGSLYGVSERRGSIFVICTTGHSLCFIYINKWPARGFWNRISCIVCFSSLPTTIGAK